MFLVCRLFFIVMIALLERVEPPTPRRSAAHYQEEASSPHQSALDAPNSNSTIGIGPRPTRLDCRLLHRLPCVPQQHLYASHLKGR